jgi:hypothetical protein
VRVVTHAVGSADAYAIEWDNRLFSTVGVFRSYLLGLGVDWSSFIAKHPAVVTQTGLPFIKWDGKQIYDQASLTRVLSRDGVAYRSWAGKHPRAATLLAGRPVATAQRTTARVVQKKVAITWAGIGFTNADGLRSYIVRQKLDSSNAWIVTAPHGSCCSPITLSSIILRSCIWLRSSSIPGTRWLRRRFHSDRCGRRDEIEERSNRRSEATL